MKSRKKRGQGASKVNKTLKVKLVGRNKVKVREGHLNPLELIVKTVKDCNQQGIIGGATTEIALKNEKSFLHATSKKGVSLIENDTQLFSGKLPSLDNSLLDIIYVDVLDSYLLASEAKLYRKDIDGRPLRLFMDLICGLRFGACLRYSKIKQRVVVNKDGSNIAVINPKTRKIEIEVRATFRDQIRDFRLFGQHENRVVAVTTDGYALLYSLDHANKRGVIDQYQLNLSQERQESAGCLAVCPKNKYVLVEVQARVLPRIIILKLTQDSIVKTACIDQESKAYGGYGIALECFGYVGTHITWVALTNNYWETPVTSYGYDTKTGEFCHRRLAVFHEEKNTHRLHRIGSKFYYIGAGGRLMSLRAKYK